ncbi:MAG: hypothetical protein AAF503_05760, partial [Pseudomonadota bacterium]
MSTEKDPPADTKAQTSSTAEEISDDDLIGVDGGAMNAETLFAGGPERVRLNTAAISEVADTIEGSGPNFHTAFG